MAFSGEKNQTGSNGDAWLKKMPPDHYIVELGFFASEMVLLLSEGNNDL